MNSISHANPFFSQIMQVHSISVEHLYIMNLHCTPGQCKFMTYINIMNYISWIYTTPSVNLSFLR